MFLFHYSRQISPLYFLVPRKDQLFGVRLDKIPRQYNYLVDENETIGILYFLHTKHIHKHVSGNQKVKSVN